MMKRPTRRKFLLAAPVSAVAGFALADEYASAAPAPVPFQVFPAATLQEAMLALQAKPGNDNLFTPPSLPFAIVMTVEDKKAAAEFEWHEGRDHILQIVEGSTRYELGGTPKDTHKKGPGEWLAPSCEGSTARTLNKGDLLVIPRGTPHKRTTDVSVTFYLISTNGTVPA